MGSPLMEIPARLSPSGPLNPPGQFLGTEFRCQGIQGLVEPIGQEFFGLSDLFPGHLNRIHLPGGELLQIFDQPGSLIYRKDWNLLQTAGWKTYDDLSFMDDGRQVLKRFAKCLCKTDLHRLRFGLGEYLCVCPGWMKTEARARGAQLGAQFSDPFGASGFGWKTLLYHVRIAEILAPILQTWGIYSRSPSCPPAGPFRWLRLEYRPRAAKA